MAGRPTVLALLALLLAPARGDMRSSVFAAVVARSGQSSDCAAFSSLFAADASYESPVGAGAVRGPAAIAAQCEAWNKLVNPATGNGWYPGALFSSNNRTSFTLQVRTVSMGGCRVDIQGIVTVDYDDAAGKLASWSHYYDQVWVNPDLLGKCATQ